MPNVSSGCQQKGSETHPVLWQMCLCRLGPVGCASLVSCCVCCCLSEIEAKYDKKMKMLRDELDLRRKTEIHEVEERKNGQISTLMQRHEEAFTDMKNYYNDITLNSLALINALKVLLLTHQPQQPPYKDNFGNVPHCP